MSVALGRVGVVSWWWHVWPGGLGVVSDSLWPYPASRQARVVMNDPCDENAPSTIRFDFLWVGLCQAFEARKPNEDDEAFVKRPFPLWTRVTSRALRRDWLCHGTGDIRLSFNVINKVDPFGMLQSESMKAEWRNEHAFYHQLDEMKISNLYIHKNDFEFLLRPYNSRTDKPISIICLIEFIWRWLCLVRRKSWKIYFKSRTIRHQHCFWLH